MKMLGVKKYIVTIWVLLTTLVFSTIALNVVSIINKKSEYLNTNKTSAIATDVIDETNGIVYLNSNFANNKSYCVDPDENFYSGTITVDGADISYHKTGIDHFVDKKIITRDIYENYDLFVIQDSIGLQIFADNVWWIDPHQDDRRVSTGTVVNARSRDFYNKTVELDCDIDVGSIALYSTFRGVGWDDHWNGSYGYIAQFAGTFDGRGKTVQYFNLSSDNRVWKANDEGGFIGIGQTEYQYTFCGFFNAVRSDLVTIKNLRLANFTAKECEPTDKWKLYVGGLVGYSGVQLSTATSKCTIENVAIENFDATFANNDANKEYAASIVCKGMVEIRNCYVSNCSENGDVTNFNHIGPFDLKDSGSEDNDLDILYSNAALNDCVVKNYNTYKYNLSDGQTFVENVYVNWNPTDETYPQNGVWNVNSAGATFNEIPVHYTSFRDLSVSQIGGAFDSSIWYQSNDYNSGWPKLRILMNWNRISFSSEDESMGTVSPNQIYIPSDAFERFSIYANSLDTTFSSLVIYNQTIRASRNIGYAFSHWSYEITASSAIFTAHFTEATLIISFLPANNGEGSYNVYPTSPNFASGSYDLTVSAGERIELKCEHDEDNYTKIIYTIGDNEVTYRFAKKYIVSDYGSIFLSLGVLGTQTLPIEGCDTVPDLTYYDPNATSTALRPTVKLKTYDSNFQ